MSDTRDDATTTKAGTMKFRQLTPMLWTTDIPATIDFYQSVLDFQVNEYNADWGWCSLSKDAVELMFARPNAHVAFNGPSLTGSLYLYTEAVDELWAKLKLTPHIYYPIENFEYGMREFAIKDNNGYILQFGKELLQ